MSRGGQVVQGIYTCIQTYRTPHDPAPLHKMLLNVVSVFSITPTFAFWKRVNMSIAYMKETAHQKPLKVCLIKNLKAVPLDR